VCRSILQCVAVCCSVLQCVAVCCSESQRIVVPQLLHTPEARMCYSVRMSVCCSTLQRVAGSVCSVTLLQYFADSEKRWRSLFLCVLHCGTLQRRQCVSENCSALHTRITRMPVSCSVLQ